MVSPLIILTASAKLVRLAYRRAGAVSQLTIPLQPLRSHLQVLDLDEVRRPLSVLVWQRRR